MEKNLCQWFTVFFREEQQNWGQELWASPWTVFQLFVWWPWHCTFFYYSMLFLKRLIFIVWSASSPSLEWNTIQHVKSFWQLRSPENTLWGAREMQGMAEYNMNPHLRQEEPCRTDQWKIWFQMGNISSRGLLWIPGASLPCQDKPGDRNSAKKLRSSAIASSCPPCCTWKLFWGSPKVVLVSLH